MKSSIVNRRIISLALVFVAVISVFCGCGGSTSVSSDESAQTGRSKSDTTYHLFSVNGIKTVRFSSEPGGYEYSFHGSSVKKISDYFSAFEFEKDNTISDVTGMSWNVELIYEDGHAESLTVLSYNSVFVKASGEKYKVKDGKKIDIDRLIDSLKDAPSNMKSTVLTIAKARPGCPAFEYKNENPYCFYAFDNDGNSYRVIWPDIEHLKEEDKVEVFYIGDKKTFEYEEYPDGGWTVKYEINALSVEKRILPENEEEQQAEQIYKYDKYSITQDAREYISDREYALYKRMVDSILSHNGTVEGFESYEEFFSMWGFLLSEFVPASEMIQSYLHSDEPFTYENGTVTFKFLYDKDECEECYKAFEDIMNDALSLIKENDSDWQRIAKLYLYVSEHMSYGSVYEKYGVSSNLYNCIIYGTGMCTEYAYYLNILARQIGFEVTDARSEGKNGFEGADHCWSMIRVEGEWYHFDPCWESPSLTHEDMEYFAFSTEERYNSLANNNPWGETGELEMFDMHDHTYARTELPVCDVGMSRSERKQLYLSVIDEYNSFISKDIPENELEEYIDNAIKEFQFHLENGGSIGVELQIKPNTLNSAVNDLIINYSPKDKENYSHLQFGGDVFKDRSVVLKHIDQTDLRVILHSIIKEDIVIEQSVKLFIP